MHRTLLPIQDVARKLEIPDQYLEPLGRYGAKVRLELLADPAHKRKGKLVLTTPTASGEGKAGWRAATTARRTAVIQEKGTKVRRRASCRGGDCLFRALNEYSREMLFVADGDEGPQHDDHNRKRNPGRRHERVEEEDVDDYWPENHQSERNEAVE